MEKRKPRLNLGRKRKPWKQLSLTIEEKLYQLLEDKISEDASFINKQDFIRYCIERELRQAKPRSKICISQKDIVLLRDYYLFFKAIENNLNQIARVLNTRGLDDVVYSNKIKAIVNEIEDKLMPNVKKIRRNVK